MADSTDQEVAAFMRSIRFSKHANFWASLDDDELTATVSNGAAVRIYQAFQAQRNAVIREAMERINNVVDHDGKAQSISVAKVHAALQAMLNTPTEGDK